MFLEQNPKIFRACLRSCSGGRLFHVSIDFFFLWIIAYYYYYLAFRRHSAMIHPHGSTWINMDHKTYFSTMNYDPNVLTFWIIKPSASVWYTGSFPDRFRIVSGHFSVMLNRFLVSTQRNRCVETKKRQRQKAPADFSVGADESLLWGISQP